MSLNKFWFNESLILYQNVSHRKLADWFFDGFFVDWMIQDRINNAEGRVAEAARQVENILKRLQSF